MLARIDALDGDVHAFNQVTADLAIAAAEKLLTARAKGEGGAALIEGGGPRVRRSRRA